MIMPTLQAQQSATKPQVSRIAAVAGSTSSNGWGGRGAEKVAPASCQNSQAPLGPCNSLTDSFCVPSVMLVCFWWQVPAENVVIISQFSNRQSFRERNP